MVIPFGPASEKVEMNHNQASDILRKLGGKLIRWNTGDFGLSENPEWYAIICKMFSPLEVVKSKLRNEMKNGISNCKVEMVDFDFIRKNGYDIYMNAVSRYKSPQNKITDKKSFMNDISKNKDYQDIVHFWGVFHLGKLIGYSSNFVFETEEVLYSTIKLDPDYLHTNSSYALIYSMNQYYLRDNGYEYVNSGYRSLLHVTNFQQFLMKNFNFYKAGIAMDVHYKTPFNYIVKATYPIRSFAGKFDNRLKAVLKLEKIRRSYNEAR
jgi:hypothetical protein